MSKTKPFEVYPHAQFWALAQRAAAGEVTIPCPRPRALSIQAEFYAWRRACEASPERARDRGIDPLRLRDVAFRVTDAGLLALPSALVGTAAVLEAALGPIAPLRTEAEQALDRLRSMGLGPKEGGST